jgi:hypothetical protein
MRYTRNFEGLLSDKVMQQQSHIVTKAVHSGLLFWEGGPDTPNVAVRLSPVCGAWSAFSDNWLSRSVKSHRFLVVSLQKQIVLSSITLWECNSMRISGIFLFFRHKDTRNTYFFTFFDLQHEHQHSNTQIKGYTIFYNTHWCPIFMLWGINVVCGVRRGQSVRVASLGLVLFGCCISGLTIVVCEPEGLKDCASHACHPDCTLPAIVNEGHWSMVSFKVRLLLQHSDMKQRYLKWSTRPVCGQQV